MNEGPFFNARLFFFLSFFFAIGIFLSGNVLAALADFGTSQEIDYEPWFEDYIGRSSIDIWGTALPETTGDSQFVWYLELGEHQSDEDSEIVSWRKISADSKRSKNEQLLLDNFDLSSLTFGKTYTIRLVVKDSTGEDSAEFTFIRSRTYQIKLVSSGSNVFYSIQVYLRGRTEGVWEEIDYFSDEDFADFDTICKATCLMDLDAEIFGEDLFLEREVDVMVVAEDKPGNLRFFFKKYNYPMNTIELSTGDGQLVQTNARTVFDSKSIPFVSGCDEASQDVYHTFSEDGIYVTNENDCAYDSIKVQADTGMIYDDYYFSLNYYNYISDSTGNFYMKILGLDFPFFYPFTSVLYNENPASINEGKVIFYPAFPGLSNFYSDETFIRRDQEYYLGGSSAYNLVSGKQSLFYYQPSITGVEILRSVSGGTSFDSSWIHESIYYKSGDIEFFKDPFYLSLGIDGKTIIGKLRDATEGVGVFSGLASGSGATITRPDRSTFTLNNELQWVFDECETKSCKIGDVYHVDWSLQRLFADGRTLKTSEDFTFAGDRFIPGKTTPFLRGDANDDGKADLSDSIFILEYLFRGREAPRRCMDSADVNDDGTIDIADPIRLLFILFQRAGPIPEPYLRYDTDPTLDDLPCEP